MNSKDNFNEESMRLLKGSDADTFKKGSDRFLRLVKEIEEMAGVIEALSKSNRQYRERGLILITTIYAGDVTCP